MLFFKQAAFYKSVQGAFTYDVMASEWEWGRQNTLFKERVYVLFDMVYTKRTIQNFDCLSSPVSE